MVDTIRSLGDLQTLYADNSTGEISAQDFRDGLVSMYNAGKQTMWIPAGAMRPTVTNGCAVLTEHELSVGNQNLSVLDFDASSDEHAQFSVNFPKSWNLGTVTFQFAWTSSGSVSTGVAMGLQAVSVADGGALDVSYGTAVVVTDDAQGTAYDYYLSSESSAITIGGSPADDYRVSFNLYRDVSDANDDMTQDLRLLGINLFYTTDLPNDN